MPAIVLAAMALSLSADPLFPAKVHTMFKISVPILDTGVGVGVNGIVGVEVGVRVGVGVITTGVGVGVETTSR